jgi:hypothetical protein
MRVTPRGLREAALFLQQHQQRNAQVLLVQKLLSELARDPGGGNFKDLHQQKDDQQLEPMQKPFVGGAGGAGAGAHP